MATKTLNILECQACDFFVELPEGQMAPKQACNMGISLVGHSGRCQASLYVVLVALEA